MWIEAAAGAQLLVAFRLQLIQPHTGNTAAFGLPRRTGESLAVRRQRRRLEPLLRIGHWRQRLDPRGGAVGIQWEEHGPVAVEHVQRSAVRHQPRPPQRRTRRARHLPQAAAIDADAPYFVPRSTLRVKIEKLSIGSPRSAAILLGIVGELTDLASIGSRQEQVLSGSEAGEDEPFPIGRNVAALK